MFDRQVASEKKPHLSVSFNFIRMDTTLLRPQANIWNNLSIVCKPSKAKTYKFSLQAKRTVCSCRSCPKLGASEHQRTISFQILISRSEAHKIQCMELLRVKIGGSQPTTNQDCYQESTVFICRQRWLSWLVIRCDYWYEKRRQEFLSHISCWDVKLGRTCLEHIVRL